MSAAKHWTDPVTRKKWKIVLRAENDPETVINSGKTLNVLPNGAIPVTTTKIPPPENHASGPVGQGRIRVSLIRYLIQLDSSQTPIRGPGSADSAEAREVHVDVTGKGNGLINCPTVTIKDLKYGNDLQPPTCDATGAPGKYSLTFSAPAEVPTAVVAFSAKGYQERTLVLSLDPRPAVLVDEDGTRVSTVELVLLSATRVAGTDPRQNRMFEDALGWLARRP